MKLKTFEVYNKNGKLTEKLTTSRELGRFLQNVYKPEVIIPLLYVNSSKQGAEYHPGTKIGIFFDTNTFNRKDLHSVYIPVGSETYKQLVSTNLAEKRDISTISNKCGKTKCIRCFTLEQIQLFIDTFLPSEHPTLRLDITKHLGTNKRIKVFGDDYKKFIYDYNDNKKPLFEVSVKGKEDIPSYLSKKEYDIIKNYLKGSKEVTIIHIINKEEN